MAEYPLEKNPRSRIAELRKRADLTQFELAERVGVTEQTIGNWERDRTGDIGIERVALLTVVLQCTMHDLLTKNIGDLRRQAGKTQLELARAVKAREGTIAAWENKGTLQEKIEQVARLCDALGCSSPDELLGEPPKRTQKASSSRLSTEDLIRRFEKRRSTTPKHNESRQEKGKSYMPDPTSS